MVRHGQGGLENHTTSEGRMSSDDRRGVTVREDDATPGLTLYTSGHAAAAYLIDLDGQLVHEWNRPFSSVWDATSKVERPVSDRQVYFRKAHMFQVTIRFGKKRRRARRSVGIARCKLAERRIDVGERHVRCYVCSIQ